MKTSCRNLGCIKDPSALYRHDRSIRHKNSYFEWVKDKLRAPDTGNAAVDGADAANFVSETGERVGNHSQISIEVHRHVAPCRRFRHNRIREATGV